jgi:hypothetical protein
MSISETTVREECKIDRTLADPKKGGSGLRKSRMHNEQSRSNGAIADHAKD